MKEEKENEEHSHFRELMYNMMWEKREHEGERDHEMEKKKETSKIFWEQEKN